MSKLQKILPLIIFLFGLVTARGHASPEESIKLVFAPGSTELLSITKDKLQTVKGELDSDPLLIVEIAEATIGVRNGSTLFNLERVRGLKVMQWFCDQGIDPARLDFVALKGPATKELISIKTVRTEGVRKTNPIEESSDLSSAGEHEFRFFFPKNSAEFIALSDEKFKEFFQSLGKPSHDAIEIEGYTDPHGPGRHNEILSEFRALRVYEHLVRSGIPPVRIRATGRGVAIRSKQQNVAKSDLLALERHVVIRWITSAEVSEIEPSKPDMPTIEIVPEANPQRALDLELLAIGGQFMPQGELKNHAKSSSFFGLGISQGLWRDSNRVWRAAVLGTSQAKLNPIKPDRDGSLNVQLFSVRSDYVFETSLINPYLGGGLSYFKWSGAIAEPSTERQNVGSNNDVGVFFAIGAEYQAFSLVKFAGEVSYLSVGGKFNETLVVPLIILRWLI